MIIEDDVDIAENLKSLLEIEGYTSDVAKDGLEGLNRLRSASELPGLILLDLMMPTMDGFQFREAQMNDPALAKIPVAIMTAGGNIEAKIAAMNVEVSFRKPLDIDKLLATIDKYTAV